MNRAELTELIQNGENSGVEFKRDDIVPERLAKEMAAILNLEGGHILLGVEDDRTVSGLTREPKKAEEWVMEVARAHLRPAAIPYWETIEWSEGKIVGIVTLPADWPDKPYKAKRGSAWVTQARVGTTTRDATDEEEVRLYQQSGRLQYDRKPVPGSSFADFDQRRLVNYFRDVRRQAYPEERDQEGWIRLLANTGPMAEDRGRAIPTAGGLLLFGTRPKRFLPQSGVTAVAYAGTEKDYEAKERSVIRGPVVALLSEAGEIVEPGVIDQALDFVRRNTSVKAWIADGRRWQERWDYPLDAIREAVVNAIAHRDYTITVTDIELSIYLDRLEVISPGRLPTTVIVDKMCAGCRVSRNEFVKDVLRDYGYILGPGLGVPHRIVQSMLAHNSTKADLIEDDERFIVRLWKERWRVIPKVCKRPMWTIRS